jgi:hypothetical protein
MGRGYGGAIKCQEGYTIPHTVCYQETINFLAKYSPTMMLYLWIKFDDGFCFKKIERGDKKYGGICRG